jgi:hypothetical protein
MTKLSYNHHYRTIEELADGMVHLLQKFLCASTKIMANVNAGDRVIKVDNSFRFIPGEEVLLRNERTVWLQDQSRYNNEVEYHVIEDVISTTEIRLKNPVAKGILTSDKSVVQKCLRRAMVFPSDIMFGDRAIVTWDQIGICVEPESRSGQWLTINGNLSDEWKLSILVYVKIAGTAEKPLRGAEELAHRACARYCDAIRNLLSTNIHLDVAIDDVPLVRDAQPGDEKIYIPASLSSGWTPDFQTLYELQDNYQSQWGLTIVGAPSSSTSSSDLTFDSDESSRSSLSGMSDSSNSSSTSSYTSMSSFSSNTVSSNSSGSSRSSIGGIVGIRLNYPVACHFRVDDKAVFSARLSTCLRP